MQDLYSTVQQYSDWAAQSPEDAASIQTTSAETPLASTPCYPECQGAKSLEQESVSIDDEESLPGADVGPLLCSVWVASHATNSSRTLSVPFQSTKPALYYGLSNLPASYT